MASEKPSKRISYHRKKRHYNSDYPYATKPQFHRYTGKGYPDITNIPEKVTCSICRNELIKQGLLREG